MSKFLRTLYLRLYAASIVCIAVSEEVESAIIKKRLDYFLTKAFLIGERSHAYLSIEAGLLNAAHPDFIFRAVQRSSNDYSVYTIIFLVNKDGNYIPSDYLTKG